MREQLYRIVCLKRSKLADSNEHEYLSDWYKHCHIAYWMPDRAGYTFDINQAGKYTSEELDRCMGVHLDWFAMRVEREL